MREFFIYVLFFLFSGCSFVKNPQKHEVNWEQIYEKELQIALEHDDIEAFMFFWPEYLKER